jgi:methionyl-tRNA synthetase
LSPDGDIDADFINDVNGLLKDYIEALDAVKLRLGLQIVMQLSARGNGYLQAAGLGNSLRDNTPKRCAQVIARAINLIYILSTLTYPYMPATSESILKQLNAPARTVPTVIAHDVLAGHQIGKPEHLFKKIDEKMADVWRGKFAGIKPAAVTATPATDGTHGAPGTSKKKGKAANKAVADSSVQSNGPKTADVLAWEEKVATQGQAVRELKAKTPKTPELDEEVAAAVVELKKLKAELAVYQKQA